MVQRKKSAHVVSTANGASASQKTGVEVSQRKSKGRDPHWDFLDDIEAPMWVDLTQDCRFTYQDRNDEWFNISHPFHHCSSKQLISAFTSASEGCAYLDLSLQEQYSPKLPCSVSRSRGKDCHRSRKCGQTNDMVTFDEQHSVNNLRNRPLSVTSVTDKVSSNKTSHGRPLGLAGSQTVSIDESNLSDAQHDQSAIRFGDHKLLSNSASFKGAESNLTCIGTSESSEHQQHKSLEVSSQVSVQTSRFLSALKISLRKSCVTRQASRMQVTVRQSEGQNSSSSKSSVGSSLTHSSDGKDLTVRENKGKTLGSTCVAGVTMATSERVNVVKISSASNPNLRSRSSALPSSKLQNTQGKVQQRKVLVPCRVNECSSMAATRKGKEKAVATSCHQISAGAKENLSREMVESQKSNTRVKVTRDVVQVQKVITRKLPENCGKTKLVSQKEKLSGRGKAKSGTMAKKAYYFRWECSIVKECK